MIESMTTGTDARKPRCGGGAVAWAMALCVVVAALAGPASAARRGGEKKRRPRGDDREKYIPTETYRDMTVFERAAYDKAMKLHRETEYRTAGDLFRKFALQFEDSVGMPYAMLMEARCMHKDRKRLTAIKKYTEILDYFPEAPSIAVPALYYRAMAKFENGDKLPGYKDFHLLVENESYVPHALGVPAMTSLADYYYDNDRQEQAVGYWKSLLKRNIHKHEHARYLARIRTWYVTNANFAGYLRFRLVKADAADASTFPAQLVVMSEIVSSVDKTNRELAHKAFKFLLSKKNVFATAKCMLDGDAGGKYSRGFYETTLAFRDSVESGEFATLAGQAVAAFAGLTKGDGRYYTVGCSLAELIGGATGDKINDEMVKQLGLEKDLAVYVARACKVAAQAGGRTRDVLHKAVITRMGKEPDDATFLKIAMGLNAEGKLKDSKAFKPMATQILVRIGRQQAGKARDDLMAQYIPGWSGYEAGYKLLVRIGNVKRRYTLHLDMLGHENKWPDYVTTLDEFEKATPATKEGLETKNWIRERRAWVYHHRVRRWADAITLYHAIDRPPGTLWNIQDCQGRLKKFDEQLRTLRVIKASFPPEGPRAMQQIVRVYQRQKGDKAKARAIAACRTIMKEYKTHSVASWAHQELEKYGLATGGGVLDED